MKMNPSRLKLADDAGALANAEQLLNRYPDVDPEEKREIARYLKNASVMDIGLLSSNRQAWANAERFRSDHRDIFATTPLEYAMWVLFVGTVIALTIWLWDFAVTG